MRNPVLASFSIDLFKVRSEVDLTIIAYRFQPRAVPFQVHRHSIQRKKPVFEQLRGIRRSVLGVVDFGQSPERPTSWVSF